MNYNDYNFLEIVKGDTFTLRVSMSEDDIEDISTMYWTCSDLGLEAQMERQDLVNDDGTTDYGFEVTISSTITSDFEAIRSVYNITAIYNDDSVATCLYEGLIRIYDKE